MNQTLREMLRRQAGRESTPSAAIVDSQSVKTTEVAHAVSKNYTQHRLKIYSFNLLPGLG